MPHATPTAARRRRPGAGTWVLALAGVLLFALFVSLGHWQVERRAWKLALIARVDARLAAPATDAPGPAAWPAVGREADEYRRVKVSGTFLYDREVLVQASTVFGAGHWVLTPLRTPAGWTVLVNRGFVPPEGRAALRRPDGMRDVQGLLRITEPGGAFLRENDPAAGRWHSRDVQAIAAAQRLEAVAPYFIDEAGDGPAPTEATAPVGPWPYPGMTVVAFRNSHLIYAATWYGLALMVVLAAWLVWRHRPGRPGPDDNSAPDNADPDTDRARKRHGADATRSMDER